MAQLWRCVLSESSTVGVGAALGIASREDAEHVLGECRQLAREKSILVDSMDLAICQAKAKWDPNINLLDRKIAERTAVLEIWLTAFRSSPEGKEFFKDKKSLQLMHGTIGFRLGKRALLLLSRKKWDDVLTVLKESWKDYVRTKEEPDKDKILKDSAGPDAVLKPANLSQMGVKVVQEESFFADFN